MEELRQQTGKTTMKLIPEWRLFFKLWSVKLGILGTSITGLLVSSPDAALYAWNLLPVDLKAVIPPTWTPLIGVFVFVMSMLAKLIKQDKLSAEARKTKGGNSNG